MTNPVCPHCLKPINKLLTGNVYHHNCAIEKSGVNITIHKLEKTINDGSGGDVHGGDISAQKEQKTETEEETVTVSKEELDNCYTVHDIECALKVTNFHLEEIADHMRHQTRDCTKFEQQLIEQRKKHNKKTEQIMTAYCIVLIVIVFAFGVFLAEKSGGFKVWQW